MAPLLMVSPLIGAADADVVQVRGHDDVLVLQFRVGARQHADDVGRFQAFTLDRDSWRAAFR